MAFSSILRRSGSSFAPLTARALQSQRNRHSAIFTALNQMRIIPSEPRLSPFLPPSSYSTKRLSPDENLLRFLDSAIQRAEETVEHDRIGEAPAEFPFEIEDNPGFIMMSREYQGEQIKVEVSMPDSNSSDDEEDYNDDKWSIPLVVSVAKGKGQFIEFDCTAWLDVLLINRLAIKNPENSEDQIAYEEPEFRDLDKNLKEAFDKYLAIRGIKASTVRFLHEYMTSKSSRGPLMWWKTLKKFVEA